jgi:hypothetical protein
MYHVTERRIGEHLSLSITKQDRACKYGGGGVGSESRILWWGVLLAVTHCHKGKKLAKTASRIL